MHIKKHSGIYTLETQQLVPAKIENTWKFFSNPANLNNITPKNMGFKITSNSADKMYKGQIITYKIGIFPFIKSNWVTEITEVKENSYFIDEQRIGPYKMWHHEHVFIPLGNQTKIIDKVSSALSFIFSSFSLGLSFVT